MPEGAVSIRALGPAEWELFRDFRLGALKESPGVFATPRDDVAARGPAGWRAVIEGPSHQVFGLFDGERLVGTAAVFTSNNDPSGQTALLVTSYLLPEYRGRRLSHMFYEARLGWIRSRPQFKRVVVAHRASNEMVRRAVEHCGFVRTRAVPRVWPDGVTEDAIWYELRL